MCIKFGTVLSSMERRALAAFFALAWRYFESRGDKILFQRPLSRDRYLVLPSISVTQC